MNPDLGSTLADLPVEWFVLFGSFVEGIVSPLPMFLVLVPAGLAVAAQGGGAWYLGVLALLAGLGRVAGALLLYWLGGRLFGAAFARRPRWFGVDESMVERLGHRISRRPHHTWWVVFGMWALPVFPSAPITLACSLVKLPLTVFISATFVGVTAGSLFYLIVGYLGAPAVALWQHYELAGQLVGVALLAAAVVWLVQWARKHG